MANSVPIGQGYTPAQWQTWFTGFSANNPKMPKYTGTNAAGRGKTWGQLYPVLQKQAPSATPDQIAEVEIQLIQVQAVADGIGATVQYTGTTAAIAGKSAADTGAALGNAIPGLNAITSVEGFLSALGNLNLWIRVVKIVAGGVILAIGLAKLTGADQHVTGVTKKAIAAAPLL